MWAWKAHRDQCHLVILHYWARTLGPLKQHCPLQVFSFAHSTKMFLCPRFPVICWPRMPSPCLCELESWIPREFPVWKKPPGILALSVTREVTVKPCSEIEQTPGEAVGFPSPCGRWSLLGSRGSRCFGVLSRHLAVSQLRGSKATAQPSSDKLTWTCLLFLPNPAVLSYETL